MAVLVNGSPKQPTKTPIVVNSDATLKIARPVTPKALTEEK